MPADKLTLRIGRKRVQEFYSYNITADVYQGAGTFQVDAVAPENVSAEVGDQCSIYINDTLELTGIIDRRVQSYSKDSRSLILEGRDYMGMVVDSYCTEFVSLKNKTLKEIATELLAPITYANRQKIEFSPEAQEVSTLTADAQIEPGARVFDVLKSLSIAMGIMFYSRPDGTFVFGRPPAKGQAKLFVNQAMQNRTDISSRPQSGELMEDLSRRYSEITVITQKQKTGEFDSAADINESYTLTDRTYPNSIYKPFVEVLNEQQSPAKRAWMLLAQQRSTGTMLRYTMAGHSQNGINWSPGRLVGVNDRELNFMSTMLIYARTFRMSRAAGAVTDIQLGVPGVVQ